MTTTLLRSEFAIHVTPGWSTLRGDAHGLELLRQRLLVGDRGGGNLQQRVAGTGDEEVLLPVPLVGDQAQGLVHRAELGDRAAPDEGAGYQVGEWEVHHRRAGIGGQDAAAAVERDQGADRGGGLVLAVVHVIDLHRGGLRGAVEGEGDAPSRDVNSSLLVPATSNAPSTHAMSVMVERLRGTRATCRVVPATSKASLPSAVPSIQTSWRSSSAEGGSSKWSARRDAVELDEGQIPAGRDPDQRRRRVSATAAGDREVDGAGRGMHGHAADHGVVAVDPQQ